jgi:GTP-binding protein Era
MSIETKSGYVAIIGKPNVGKSTLMNAIIGAKLSIVTPKPQTTRKRVLGIYTEEITQIIFLDTPGILNPKYKMQSAMMNYVSISIDEAECIIYIYDVSKYKPQYAISNDVKNILTKINQTNKKIICILNKLDLLNDVKKMLPIIAEMNSLNLFSDIIPISALKKNNIKDVTKTIRNYLPNAPFYYDVEMLSTQPERFFVSEIIRENIFFYYKEEIPYSTEVDIIEFKERERGKWYINAEIIIEKKTQKGIIIGKNGEKLKLLMERSRASIEEHLQMDVYLEVFVKVRPKWRNNIVHLKSFGY